MASYGYARVSTFDQDLTVQRQALRAAGCSVVRSEKVSGSRRDGRTELQVLLDFVQPGDTLVVTRIDRLARSLKDLQDIIHELKNRGVALRATEQPVDTGTAAARPSSTCWAYSPSSKPICGASVSLKVSRRPKPGASIAGANLASTWQRSGACATRTGWELPRSRAGSGSGALRSTARWELHDDGGRHRAD
jgi:hypothetical protein